MLPSEYIQKGWTKGESARLENDNFCMINDPDAVKWCLLGSIYKSRYSRTISLPQRMRLEKYISLKTKGLGMIMWNDSRKSAKPVIKMLQEAEREVLGIG